MWESGFWLHITVHRMKDFKEDKLVTFIELASFARHIESDTKSCKHAPANWIMEIWGPPHSHISYGDPITHYFHMQWSISDSWIQHSYNSE